MNDLIISTIPFPEFQKLLNTTVQTAVEQATAHLKPNETASILSVSLVTLNEWTKEGKIKGYRIGSRIRFKQHEIEKSLLSIKTK